MVLKKYSTLNHEIKNIGCSTCTKSNHILTIFHDCPKAQPGNFYGRGAKIVSAAQIILLPKYD